MIRYMLTILGAACFAPLAHAASCPTLNPATLVEKPMREIRIVTGPDGESHFDDTQRNVEAVKLFGGAFTLRKYPLGTQAKVTLVIGPSNMDLPFHPTPYPEMFLMLSGTVSMRLADGTHREAGPGVLISMEDVHSAKGHAGATGPCGYMSFSIAQPPKS